MEKPLYKSTTPPKLIQLLMWYKVTKCLSNMPKSSGSFASTNLGQRNWTTLKSASSLRKDKAFWKIKGWLSFSIISSKHARLSVFSEDENREPKEKLRTCTLWAAKVASEFGPALKTHSYSFSVTCASARSCLHSRPNSKLAGVTFSTWRALVFLSLTRQTRVHNQD